MAGRKRFMADEARAARAARFAAQLTAALYALGLTHQDLAQALGVARYTVDSWTRNADAKIPGPRNLAQLCALCEQGQSGLGQTLAAAAGLAWTPALPPTRMAPGSEPSGVVLAAPLPVLPAADPTRTNLPLPLTSFVGREQAQDALRDLLAVHRLVTLTGAGGIGKTRLAVQVGARLTPAYPHGVWLVDLAALRDPDLVLQAVAAALGVRPAPPTAPLLPALVAALQPRHLLLILDNCEHLIAACALLATQLLQTCPLLTLLTTSREALRIPGEAVWRVPPLALPTTARPTPAEIIAGSEAVRLFVERARAAGAGFVLTPQTAPTVAQICQRLDGLPLAIELVAALAPVLAVEQIATRLDDRFGLLSGGSRTALPRQQSLRALVDWSYHLLDEAEQVLLRRLAVFAGGWTLEAAEAVVSGEWVVVSGLWAEDTGSGLLPHRSFLIPPPAVLEGLAGLVHKSLVGVEMQAEAARYRLLETIRVYALEQLAASGELAEQQRRHAAYFVAMAEQAEPELRGAAQGAALDRLAGEHDNLRAALDWAQDAGDAETALRLAGALWLFWWMRGHLSEGRQRLDQALALAASLAADPSDGQAERAARSTLQAQALNGAGSLAAGQGDYERARTCYQASLALRRDRGDRPGIATTLNNLGNVALSLGDSPQAIQLYQESLALRRDLGDGPGIATTLNSLGNVALTQGDYAQATHLYEESLALRRAAGDQQGIARALGNLGLIHLYQDDTERAAPLIEESLAHIARSATAPASPSP